MKKKKLFALFGLSFAMGLGAVGALRYNKGEVKEARAWGSDKYTNVYVIGSFVGSNWSTFVAMPSNANTGRKEAQITLAVGTTFKFNNTAGWDEEGSVHGVGRAWDGIKANDSMWNNYVDADADKDGNFVSKVTGTYTVYWESGSYGDLAEKGFGIEPYHAYKYSVNGGAAVAMTQVAKGDFAGQWKATLNVTVGQTFTFTEDSSAISPSVDTVENNNVTTFDSKVITTANSVDLYLKKLANGSFKYWLGGRGSEFYIYTNSTLIPMAQNPNNNAEYYATSVTLAVDQVVRFYVAALFDADINQYSTGTWSKNGSGQIVCGLAGTYNIYLTPGQTNTVYFGNPSAADLEATNYAIAFLAAMEANCPYTAQGKTTSDVATAWAAQEEAWDDLGLEAQGILTAASTSGSAKVNEFASSYNSIYNRYHTSLSLNDFADRKPAGSTATNPVVNSNNSMMLVVVISSLAIVSALGLFLLKRKQER